MPVLTSRRRLVDYAIGCGVALLAVLLQWALHAVTGSAFAFLFVAPAAAMAAALLGRGPTLVIMLAGGINALFMFPPIGSGWIASRGDLTALGGYLALCAVIWAYATRVRTLTAHRALAEQHLDLAQEGTGVGVYELDFVNNTAYVSSSLRQMLGQPGIELSIPLDRWLASLDPAQVAQTRHDLKAHVQRGELAYEREQCFQMPDGTVRWLLTRVRIDLTTNGELATARGATIDISERKRLDQRLEQTQFDLRQQVADMQRLHSLGQDLVVAGDDLAISMQAVLDLTLNFHAAQRGVLALRAANGEFAAIAQRGGAEQAAESPQTHVIPLQSTNGHVMGTISVIFDVARTRTEREIRLGEVCATMAAAVAERGQARALAAERDRRFAVALESASVPFNILAPVYDDAGTIIDLKWNYINGAAARMFGLPQEHFTGRRVTEVIPETWQTPGLLARFAAVIEGGEATHFEVEIAHHPGIWLEVIASPLMGMAAAWYTDISERKRSERLRVEADQRKDEFLATLAHELRNPLAPIRQSVRVVRSDSASDIQKRGSLDVIERQVKTMALILDDLLDVSRISRGTLLLRKSIVPLAEVFDAAIEAARPHIDTKQHHLAIELPAPPLHVALDPLRMAQVIGNLLTNAAKYSDPGGHIALRAALDGHDLVIDVSDTGIGLSAEQIEHLFEMFNQVPSSITRSQGGLGIGLALARSLVQLHDGDIAATSAGHGRGSQFTIRLPPETLASGAPSGETPTPALHTPQNSTVRRVLIADDNSDAADSLAALLRLEGHEVVVAYDGEQALSQFHEHLPEAALVDVGMPSLSGLEVARAIRMTSTGKRVMLIAVTGWGQTRDRRATLDAGFDHHATKPVDSDHILDLLNRLPPSAPAS